MYFTPVLPSAFRFGVFEFGIGFGFFTLLITGISASGNCALGPRLSMSKLGKHHAIRPHPFLKG